MTAIGSLVRPNIRRLKPYSSARQEFSGTAQILLDANENSFVSEYNRYPDPMQQRLKEAISALKAQPAENIFIGNGSDEAIDLIIRIFCRPTIDNIVVTPPTFSWFTVCAEIADVEVRQAPLTRAFGLDLPRVLASFDQNSKVLFLCSPNNPTGNELDNRAIEKLLVSFPGMVVIDEAYKDFSQRPSWIQRLGEFPRLIVTQTMSKAWGKAGLRVGMAYASAEVIHFLNAVKPPYNVNALSQANALKAISQPAVIEEHISTILSERVRLKENLIGLPIVVDVFPSAANFLLVRFTDSDAVYRKLTELGIVVRDRSRELYCDQCLRITVGTPEENNQLLNALSDMQ